jgi:ornithine cyclodeaminase/alanine dehydrogenase-like protein (mu-crystallin family)
MEIVGMEKKSKSADELKEPDWQKLPTLRDLLAGKVRGRHSENEATCFINNIGLGIQFAAVASLVYKLARQKDLGHKIPTDWFLQKVQLSTASP